MKYIPAIVSILLLIIGVIEVLSVSPSEGKRYMEFKDSVIVARHTKH